MPNANCFLVEKSDGGTIHSSLTTRNIERTEPATVLIRVLCSSLNYKDAMAATGHPGIVKNFPHIPGIDAVGEVIESDSDRYQAGDIVIATGHELGVERWGGWSEFMVVPEAWLVPLPTNLTPSEAMLIGTAGFTAAQCVDALLHSGDGSRGIELNDGPILVTGATGGVGSFSVMLLAHLGFNVTAVTGKADQHEWLTFVGASNIESREFLADQPNRPLLKGEFAGAIDTVGGSVLSTAVKMVSHRGTVACCGVVAGAELDLTVYPFILRGVKLAGIDSAWCPDDRRRELWHKLSTIWKLANADHLKTEVPFAEIEKHVPRILAGNVLGRIVIPITSN